MSRPGHLHLVLELAKAQTPVEMERARQALDRATYWWNMGRSYPPEVREELRALNLSTQPLLNTRPAQIEE